MMMSNKSDYYKSPELLLNELGITDPEEIDLEVIAQYCRATVVYKDITGSEARILGDNRNAIITVNHNSNPYRQRFSIGHELGHWMNDREKAVFSCNKEMFIRDWKGNNPESQANEYSARLLLPKFMFKPLTKGQDVNYFTVDHLAKRFRTSLTATAIRLVELGELPSMLVCCNSKRRLWFTRHPDLPKEIWPNDIPGDDSIAARILRGLEPKKEPVEKHAECWVNHPKADNYVVKEHSRKIAKDLVLSLIWWENEDQLVDLIDNED
jgi:Zn-dependent peptidase ImmA (M78 family)